MCNTSPRKKVQPRKCNFHPPLKLHLPCASLIPDKPHTKLSSRSPHLACIVPQSIKSLLNFAACASPPPCPVLLTCSSSRSEGSAWDGTSSVNISDITFVFPFTTSSSLRSFPICKSQVKGKKGKSEGTALPGRAGDVAEVALNSRERVHGCSQSWRNSH